MSAKAVRARDADDWALEMQRLRRIRAAALLEPQSERWKRLVATLCDSLSLLLAVSPDGADLAVTQVLARLDEGKKPPKMRDVK